MQEQTAEFRVVGPVGENAVTLWEIDAERTVVVNQSGDNIPSGVNSERELKELRQKIGELRPGNRISATIEGDSETSDPWEFSEVEKKSDETVVWVENPEQLPGNPEAAWENRGGAMVGTFANKDENGNVLVDGEVHPAFTEDGDSIWEYMLYGLFPIEPWFNETAHLDDGADSVIVVKVSGKPFVVVYLFGETALQNNLFEAALNAMGVLQTA